MLPRDVADFCSGNVAAAEHSSAGGSKLGMSNDGFVGAGLRKRKATKKKKPPPHGLNERERSTEQHHQFCCCREARHFLMKAHQALLGGVGLLSALLEMMKDANGSTEGRGDGVDFVEPGRLNPETCSFCDAVEKHFNIHIEYMFPDVVEVQALVGNKGLFSFYEDGHPECCRVRKVRPLRRALKDVCA